MKSAFQFGTFTVGAALIYLLVELCFAIALPKGEIAVPFGWIGLACIKFAVAVAISFLAVALLYRKPKKIKDNAIILSGFFGGLLAMLIFSSVDLSNSQAVWLYLQFIAGVFGIPVGYWLGVLKIKRRQIAQ